MQKNCNRLPIKINRWNIECENLCFFANPYITAPIVYATPPNTTIYFNDEKSRVCLSSFEIYMQAGSNWYVGLTEMAFDWIFADYDSNTEKLVDCSSTWYGRM